MGVFLSHYICGNLLHKRRSKINMIYLYNIVASKFIKQKKSYRKVTGLCTNTKYSFAALVVEVFNSPLSACRQGVLKQV